ncbi:MAG: ABC transporter permease [Acidimicrobiales bacterium]
MSAGLALVPLQLRYEQKMFWRNPASAFFTFAFPLVIFLLFASIFNGHEAALSGVKGIQYYTPVMAAYGVMSACFVNVAITITFRRELGLLKRVRGTPISPAAYLGGLIASAVVNAAIITALIVALGVLAYGSSLPYDWLGLVVGFAVGAAAFCTLGLAITGAIPNADAAPAVVNLVFFVLLFISGGFYPLPASSVLAQIAQVFPLRHFIDAGFAAFDPRRSGGAFPWGDVGIMAAWGAAGLLCALRWFRWESRKP